VIIADVTVEVAGFGGVVLHPGFGKVSHPLAGIAGGGHVGDFFPQGAHFGDAVGANGFAEFAGWMVAELLGATDAGECHEAKHAEDVQRAVVTFGQAEMTVEAGNRPLAQRLGRPQRTPPRVSSVADSKRVAVLSAKPKAAAVRSSAGCRRCRWRRRPGHRCGCVGICWRARQRRARWARRLDG